jgi:trigger factor
MKSEIKKLEKSEIEMEIEISIEEFDVFIEKAIFNLGQDIEIEGFRKGKAPREMVEKKIGEQKILMEAAETAIKESYRKAITENKIEPISAPQVEIMKLSRGNPFIFRVKIYVLPKIELPDYKKIASRVKRNEISVREEEIEDTLEWVRRSRAKFAAKNDKAEKGDFVEIEYWLSEINNPAPPQNIKDAFILGEGHLIADFEKELVGMKAGEVKEEVIFAIPENHPQKNIAGKKVKAKIKMVSVKIVEFPKINDEFAKSLGNFKDLADFRRSIKEGILQEKKQAEDRRIRDEILSSINKEIKWEIPDFLIEEGQKRLIQNLKENVADNLKISFEDYLKNLQKTEKEVLDSFKPEAEKEVKNYLILKNIEEKEEILASPKEIEEAVNKTLKNYPDIKTAEKIDPEKLKLYTESIIKEEKVLKFLESFVQ